MICISDDCYEDAIIYVRGLPYCVKHGLPPVEDEDEENSSSETRWAPARCRACGGAPVVFNGWCESCSEQEARAFFDRLAAEQAS